MISLPDDHERMKTPMPVHDDTSAKKVESSDGPKATGTEIAEAIVEYRKRIAAIRERHGRKHRESIQAG